MTPHQENKLVMYGSVIALGKRFTDLIATIPALATAYSDFTAAVGLIKTKSKKDVKKHPFLFFARPLGYCLKLKKIIK